MSRNLGFWTFNIYWHFVWSNKWSLCCFYTIDNNLVTHMYTPNTKMATILSISDDVKFDVVVHKHRCWASTDGAMSAFKTLLIDMATNQSTSIRSLCSSSGEFLGCVGRVWDICRVWQTWIGWIDLWGKLKENNGSQ